MTTNTCYAKPVTVTKGPRIAYNSYIGDSAFGTSMYYVTDVPKLMFYTVLMLKKLLKHQVIMRQRS